MEVHLNETESRYFGDLFLFCDVEKAGKIHLTKAMELYRSANVPNEVLLEIIAIAGIPVASLHISRGQFYSCLKLIAAYQAGVQLRQEIITAALPLPLPRFSWKDSPSSIESTVIAGGVRTQQSANRPNVLPPPPVAERRNSLTHRQGDWQAEAASGSSLHQSSASMQKHFQHKHQDSATNSDVHSTDSDVDQNESSCGDGAGCIAEAGRSSREVRRNRGSPEAWSTNSDSPTPTNSVAERQWAKDTLWQGLLGDEHRQLLGTEEESSDRHSSEDENEVDLESVYQISPEQRDYYYKQFKAVQHDGLLSGQVARVFFEKSRIPVEELRHIWQLCDVTRDGALSLAEFTAAMHLVVTRRNNIPLPTVLPACLHPSVLQHGSMAAAVPQEPPEADLLHLNDDDEEDKTDNTVILGNASNVARVANDKNVMNMSTLSTSSQASVGSKGNQAAPLTPPLLPPPIKNHSKSNSPNAEPNSTPPNLPAAGNIVTNKVKDKSLWGPTDVPPTQWTKFTESPTSNVSSPGPKPVNFDMQRTAQAVVSDPQILHPVPLRVTPVAGTIGANAPPPPATEIVTQDSFESANNQDTNSKQASSIAAASTMAVSSHNNSSTNANIIIHNRESLPNNDLRAIQRPQAKKLPTKNAGALPPPPQREASIGSVCSTNTFAAVGDANDSLLLNGSQQSKKDVPPLPPPRPHRHGRSSSLDLNKFKLCGSGGGQQPEITAQASFDLQTSSGFADFTHFPDDDDLDLSSEHQQYSLPPAQLSMSKSTTDASATANSMPPTRFSLQQPNQRLSAFEVYRKPHNLRNSQSPKATVAAAATELTLQQKQQQQQPLNIQQQQQPLTIQQQLSYTMPLNKNAAAAAATQQPPPMPMPFGAVGAAAIAQQPTQTAAVVVLPNADHYEKRVNAISETLKHVSFKQDNNMSDVLRHLREQNNLLLRLCNDLSDELLSVQTRKEELRLKMEALALNEAAAAGGGSVSNNNIQEQTQLAMRAYSSISAPVTANITGGSGSSGVHSNV